VVETLEKERIDIYHKRNTCFVGIDMHKDTHCAVVIDCWMNKLVRLTLRIDHPDTLHSLRMLGRFAGQRKSYLDLKIPEALAETLLPIWWQEV